MSGLIAVSIQYTVELEVAFRGQPAIFSPTLCPIYQYCLYMPGAPLAQNKLYCPLLTSKLSNTPTVLKPDYVAYVATRGQASFITRQHVLMSQHPNTTRSFCLHTHTD